MKRHLLGVSAGRTSYSPPPPTKSLLSTYMTCHSSAIDTNKGTCLPYMLLTCLFLIPHANYALNYTFKKSILSKWHYFRFRDQRVLADIWTSIDCGCSSKSDIGALEMFVYNLKSNRILRKFEHFFQCLQYYF